jgi:hypothetical protein
MADIERKQVARRAAGVVGAAVACWACRFTVRATHGAVILGRRR